MEKANLISSPNLVRRTLDRLSLPFAIGNYLLCVASLLLGVAFLFSGSIFEFSSPFLFVSPLDNFPSLPSWL